MAKRYVSNKDESARMFRRDWMEMFTHMHPATPLVLYVPPTLFFLYQAMVAPQMTLGAGVFLFLAGAFVWTLTEYLLHRFAFHYEPRTEWGKKVHFVFHGVHHDYPNDSRRLVMAPVVSIPLAILFYGLFHFLLGPVRVLAFFPGFLMGYICYDTIHYATHHFPMRNPIGLWLRHHHLRHHYQDDTYGYGVSSPLWDYVFRTNHRPKPQAQPASNRTETVS